MTWLLHAASNICPISEAMHCWLIRQRWLGWRSTVGIQDCVNWSAFPQICCQLNKFSSTCHAFVANWWPAGRQFTPDASRFSQCSDVPMSQKSFESVSQLMSLLQGWPVHCKDTQKPRARPCSDLWVRLTVAQGVSWIQVFWKIAHCANYELGF